MHEVMQPTQDAGWILTHEGYNVLTESAVESRFALANGFLGVRAARSVSRGLPVMAGFGGKVLRTNLTTEQEAKLQEALKA